MLHKIQLLLLSSISLFATPYYTELTLEEKVGQLFIVCFKGDSANKATRTLVQDLHVGGIIYYEWANGLYSPQQVRTLSSDLQNLTLAQTHPIPLLISLDQEGGIVARLKEGFSLFPGNKALGMTLDPILAQESALAIGSELRSVGVNLNLSPVVDVNSNPKNPIIGIRSFGDTPRTVITFAKKALQGYQEARVLTSIKHFPGHGDVDIDSHEALPILQKSKQELEAVELIPFKELSSLADTVMTAHLMVPSIDPKHCATLSKPILDILRKDIGFNGVIISDSLVMEGILQNISSLEEAAITAFNAGCDLLLFGGKKLAGTTTNEEISLENISKVHKAMIEAVKTGIISEDRLNQAVQRILKLKQSIPLPPPQDGSQICKTPESQALAKKISTLALRTLHNKTLPCLTEKKITLFAPMVLKNAVSETSSSFQHMHIKNTFFSSLNPSEEEISQMRSLASQDDVIFFFSYNAWKNPMQEKLIDALSSLQKPFVFIITRDPTDESLHPNADVIIKTFSPSASSIEAALQKILTTE